MVTRITPAKQSDGTGRDTYILLDDKFRGGALAGPFQVPRRAPRPLGAGEAAAAPARPPELVRANGAAGALRPAGVHSAYSGFSAHVPVTEGLFNSAGPPCLVEVASGPREVTSRDRHYSDGQLAGSHLAQLSLRALSGSSAGGSCARQTCSGTYSWSM
eukprot:CAMPEP_0197898638 /NCGR_PEP_ID=MMETSP1439-20131203/44501_1 /TAXON_ID=66791 /ORGANISM="Gonyaulax spinifera, Strain CCMP409" /LENGTH=158 /DNA_ID=CAMNT_0043519381 /DNA_START=20 /DNA_END=492 /DNA_ORIENTATION=-